MARKSIPIAVQKALFALSGNECAFPDCKAPTVDPDSGRTLAQICHIKAASLGGPRYDPDQADHERHGFHNLFILCPTHHAEVDTLEERYSPENLYAMKVSHERRAGGREVDPARIVIEGDVAFGSSSGQSGGITAGVLNVNMPDRPAPAELSDLALDLLHAAATIENARGLISVINPYGPAFFMVGETFQGPEDPRKQAKLRRSIKDLVEQGLLDKVPQNSEADFYRVTEDGYLLVESLDERRPYFWQQETGDRDGSMDARQC